MIIHFMYTITYIIIGINLIITYIGFQNVSNEERIKNFLFIPHDVARGNNFIGLILSNFSHANWGHIGFNMFSYYFFAPSLEANSSSIIHIAVYLISTAGSLLTVFLIRRNIPLYRCLGASGSVTGIIFAAIVFDPSIDIYIFFIPVPIAGPLFAVLYILISIFLASREQSGISHEAHVGGAFAGFIFAALVSPYGLEPLLQRLINIFS
jgi:membrane associated rhomboid family serine protease